MDLTPEEREQAIRALTCRRNAYREIAKKVGCEYADLRKNEIKKEIEQAQKALIILNLQKSVEGMTKIVHAENAEGDERKYQVDAYKEVMRAGGVLPSTTPSNVMLSLTQVNVFQTPEAQSVLKKFAGYLTGNKEDVVDASIVGETEEANGASSP